MLSGSLCHGAFGRVACLITAIWFGFIPTLFIFLGGCSAGSPAAGGTLQAAQMQAGLAELLRDVTLPNLLGYHSCFVKLRETKRGKVEIGCKEEEFFTRRAARH